MQLRDRVKAALIMADTRALRATAQQPCPAR